MSRSTYLDQEPGGVLVLKPVKWQWMWPCVLFWGVSLIYGYLFWIAGIHWFVKTTFDYIYLIVQWVSLAMFDAISIQILVLLLSGGGGILMNESGVWAISFEGRLGRKIEWGEVESFYSMPVLNFVILSRYTRAIFFKCITGHANKPKFAFCQGPYHDINKAELVELLNRWREKFGGTSEAASNTVKR